MISSFTAQNGRATTNARLNVRSRAPDTSAPIALTVSPGIELAVIGVGRGENVAGNDIWYAGPDDRYFWSGGCGSLEDQDADAPPPVDDPAKPVVRRRTSGTIRPHDDARMRQVFGDFDHAERAGGRVEILGGWVEENIVRMDSPALADLGFPSLQVHRKAEAAFKSVLDRIAEDGLLDLVLTCGGTFVPRHKGWNPDRTLSSHSWGVAIDLNVAWNGYGVTPSPRGARGSVVDLVPYFAAEGFAWGGYFSSPHEDGMHFELARLDL